MDLHLLQAVEKVTEDYQGGVPLIKKLKRLRQVG